MKQTNTESHVNVFPNQNISAFVVLCSRFYHNIDLNLLFLTSGIKDLFLELCTFISHLYHLYFLFHDDI